MRGRTPRWRWVAAASGILFAFAAVGCALSWQSIFDLVLAHQIALDPSSKTFEAWEAPKMPMYFDVYFFNWTNADNFPEEKPRFVELGPYRFREYRRHVNLSWYPHNASIAYRTQRTWQWEPETSNGTMDDVITTLDVVVASAIYRARNDNIMFQKLLALSLAASGHHISVTRLARELMFEGYDDTLLDIAKNLPDSMIGGAPRVDKFGWFYKRNGSMDTDGHMLVTSGAGGTLPGQIIEWNHLDYLPFYSGECSKMQGSAGEFLPHNLTEQSTLTMFISDLCRTVHMEYVSSGRLDGLPYHKYAMSPDSFDNSSTSSAHTCFCNGACIWGGVMNVSACRFGSPTFLSLPHFLHGDQKLFDMVDGMNPDPDKHSFYFAVEPRLGVPLDVAGRFQVNMYLEPNPYIALYENVPQMLFPCFWVEQHVIVNESVRAGLRYARNILDWGATFCAGCALFFAALVALATCCATKKPEYVPPIDYIVEKPKDESELKLNPL